jgi:glycosyltransferase involved in cell wall biosynthesis
MKKQMDNSKTRLNILVIPELLPYPPTDGGKLCTFMLIDYLRAFHNIHILLAAYDVSNKNNIAQLSAAWPDVTVHTVEIFSQPTQESFERKAVNSLKNVFVKFKKLYRPNSKEPAAVDVYSRYGPYFALPFNPHHRDFIKKLAEVLADNKFDIIQTELTGMLNLVNLFPVNTKKVFVQIESKGNVLFDYGISNNFNKNYIKHVAGNTAFLEYAYMSEYDAVLALNDTDANEIRQNVPATVKVYTSPFGLLDRDVANPDFDKITIENLIFIGGEGHYPNYDGLSWFLTNIITELPTGPFKNIYVTGTWSAETRQKFTVLSDSINFIGFVDDLSPYLQTSVCIVPIRIGGGGIRTKILSAMAQGSPVIATTLSSVGINGGHEKELIVADTAKDFADAITNLFANPQLARNIARNAHRLILNEYTQTAVGQKRDNIYHQICASA